MFFREFTSSKRPRSSKQSARNRSCNFQTSTKIIHITYCHMMDRLGLFYSFCCCFLSDSSHRSSVREFLRFCGSQQQINKNPLEFDQHILICCPNWDVFLPRFFKIQISQPGLKAGRFFSGRFFGRFFFASWFNPITFSAPALPMFGVFLPKHHNKHQNWNNKSSPKKPIQGLLDECLWKWWDVLCFFLTTVCAKA